MRSVEFHSEGQNEFASAARFYEDQRYGLGRDFTLAIQQTYERLNFLAAGRRLVAGSGVLWFRSSLTAYCTESRLIASTSSPLCIFTVGQATGGHGSETLLPNNRLERAGSTPAAQPERSADSEESE